MTDRNTYSRLGFDTIPLIPGTKLPAIKGWPERSHHDMWQSAPQNANIANRCGGKLRLVVIDCDEAQSPGTFHRVAAYLQRIGICPGEYPVVQTASGIGRHIYLSLDGKLGGNCSLMLRRYGAGEIRYGPGAYVVAPPSTVNGQQYSLLQGDFSHLPRINFTQLGELMYSHQLGPERSGDEPGDPINYNQPARNHKFIFANDARAYASRSEKEQALITSMVNKGFGYGEVKSHISAHPLAEKYHELLAKNPQTAERWLRLSFDKATRLGDSPVVCFARRAINWAKAIPWPGRSGGVDRDLFIAHAQISMKSGKAEFFASARELAQLGNVSTMTAARATRRLIKQRLIELVERPLHGSYPYSCRLVTEKIALSDTFLATPLNVRECITMHAHDTFRFYGLGKPSAQIYERLCLAPATVEELALATGRHPSTIRRNLNRMAALQDLRTGEPYPMVRCDQQGKWHMVEIDLGRVAESDVTLIDSTK